MASYSLEIKRSAAKELAQSPRRTAVASSPGSKRWPTIPGPPGAEKLSGQERYRVRQGDYRILYEIHDQVLRIVVVKIGHRRDVYRT